MALVDEVDFTMVEGHAPSRRVEIYALSTCAFCEKAIAWFRERGESFGYVYIDRLDPDFKARLKAELKERHGAIPVYPFVTVDRTHGVSGYDTGKYLALLES